jgi:PIN domain nuclease of toxin-antitoxin system
MNLLLDTHVLIWALENNSKLSEQARSAIIDGHNLVFVSTASMLEIAIKKSLGKLETPENLLEEINTHRFTLLPIQGDHALEITSLPDIHKDPFDRMLISQANCEKLRLTTADKMIMQYPVSFLDATA